MIVVTIDPDEDAEVYEFLMGLADRTGLSADELALIQLDSLAKMAADQLAAIEKRRPQ